MTRELDPALLAILVCPLTRTPLRWEAAAQELVSDTAGLAFPVRDGVPIMLPEHARRLAGKDADAGLCAVRPRRVDDRPRLRVDDRVDLRLERVEIARADDAFALQSCGVRRNRIARRPVLVELAIRIALIDERRVLPGGG